MNIDIKKVKISVTVPKEKVKEVRDAICSEGTDESDENSEN